MTQRSSITSTMKTRDRLAGWKGVQENQLRTGPFRLQDVLVTDQKYIDLLSDQDEINGQGLLLNKQRDDIDEEAMATFLEIHNYTNK